MENKGPNYDDTLQQLIGIISTHTGIPPNKITENKTLRRDLGIEGDDADELIETVRKTFGVNMRHYRFTDFFDPEGGVDPILLLARFIRRRFRRAPPKVPLTVGQLAHIALNGAWPQAVTRK